MEIPSKYDPTTTEDKWYAYWMDHGFFNSDPDDREPYTIVIPPPNVTGVLHMGHMLNNTIQDILVRRARMMGKNACWVPGTDHASIATEARVVAKLASEGIKKTDLTRDEFLKHAWEWKEKHGGIILEQLKKLGASCDWRRTCFTMDDAMYESVIQVFVDLYRKGYIYRGVRMVNWDPQAKTAVSDEEVIYREVKSKLYYVKYKVVGEDAFITVATTRPETILGDTAVCVHPEDERYKHLKGKKVIVPLVNREVPVIFDEYVDREFGTGALKITPAHDLADYELGLKYKLEAIDIFNEDGTLSEKAGLFIGIDRFKARELSHKKLEEDGMIVKVENYDNKLGYSERTDAVIEPRLSVQWFVKMKELAQPALENVMNDYISLYPPKYKNTYRHWMEHVKDWCISRQLWWGQRIPAYYLPNGEIVVAKTPEEALKEAHEKHGLKTLKLADLKQDEDVLDTWFSSWLWPISVFDGIRKPENKDIQYYYPTNDLITAPEILFFWVARMIIAGYEYRGDKPFNNVYLTGIVRDKQHRKMSKSLGNSPDPLDLIAKYSADGVRIGMLLCSPAGNDLLFDEGLTEQGRNFGNKIWNAFRLIHSWEVDESIPQPTHSRQAAEWFESRMNQTLAEIDAYFEKYRLSDALMAVYKLFWDEFSSWYLEIIKPEFKKPIDSRTFEATRNCLETLLKTLHSFMPFITEELWHLLKERAEGESIMLQPWPKAGTFSQGLIDDFEIVKEAITAARAIRKEKNIPLKERMDLFIKQGDKKFPDEFNAVLQKLANLSEIRMVEEKVAGAATFRIHSTEFYMPLADHVDHDEEILKLQAELEYAQGFLASVMKKLGNERFIQGAPEQVIASETQKKNDAESKIRMLEERIASLKN
jgi:valyl-tRNA synthetase